MYPLRRLFMAQIAAARSPRIGLDEVCDLSITCMPWDCDVFFEFNNGRQLTLYDIGRFVYSQRVGLVTLALKKGWTFAVAGASVRYRKRIRPFQRVLMRTRVIGVDDKWVYFLQSMIRDDVTHSSALVRTTVVANGGLKSPIEVGKELGLTYFPTPPDWVVAWADADAQRPWPPESAYL